MTEDEFTQMCEKLAAGSIIGTGDGRYFKNFLHQPAIKEALARYVHSETGCILWHGVNEMHGKGHPDGDKEGPAWLDKATEGIWEESEDAYYSLEIAIQQEVASRVEGALTEARSQEKKTSSPRLRELSRRLTAVAQQSAAEQKAAIFAETDRAMEAAGIKHKPLRKKTAPQKTTTPL